MPTTFVKGDILDTDDIHAFALGCNCAGTMDAGVALAFKKRWPAMFEEYRALCASGGFSVGDVFAWSEGDVVVYGLGIQATAEKKPKLQALSQALSTMTALAADAKVTRIGVTRIGAGKDGLDWTRVKRILADAGEQTTVSLVVFEQFVRKAPAAT